MLRILILSLALILTGCNGILKPATSQDPLPGYITLSSGFPAPYIFQGSGIQWNDEYAITVSHLPLTPNIAHRCSTGCDLVFIRHKAEKPLPNWRKAKRNENITTAGLSPLHTTVIGQGKSKALRVNLNRRGDNSKYALTSAPVMKGMSGGPVYGEGGAVVGMIVGIFLSNSPILSELNQNENLSAYIPYEIILREWKIFQSKQIESNRVAFSEPI